MIAATATRAPENYVNVIRSINTSVATLETQNNKIKITWIAGHTDIEGNDLADTAAKDAANETASTPESCSISTPEISKRIKITSIKVWQRRWIRLETGRWTYNILPKVNVKLKTNLTRCEEVKYNRLHVGAYFLARLA